MIESFEMFSLSSMHISPKSTNGGYLEIINYDAGAIGSYLENLLYSGATLTHTASFVFDFEPPYHCLGGCGTSMLETGVAFTREVST